MGGGSKQQGHTPVEAPESGRSKQRVKILEVISEGEIKGLVNGNKSIFLDNTPIQADNGKYNFSNVTWEGRSGSQDQEVMSEFNSTDREVSVSTEVRKGTPLTRTVTDSKVNRIRLTLGVQSLFQQNNQGDTNGSKVLFAIRVGSKNYTFEISGKYSSQYLRTLEITDLPPVPFTIRVERVTADSTKNTLQNKTIWSSYTEIIDTQFAYPNTAYIGVRFDSEYFSSIPTRTYEIYGMRVRVPSNYNPTTRQYSGLWDGTFKVDWTDNPAWVLMDIVTSKRYGLGDRLGEFSVDKWALYAIAQYCDQLIPNGYGGREPRFTCNLWLTDQRSAYDVLTDLCSIFRAMPVWNGTELTFLVDRPSDPVWTYTNANVIDGKFSRQYSALKARHNAIQVEYKDASNNYETAIEYVSDDAAIRKYGLNLQKVTAFGCTSRGQAYRTGRWILETEKLETETITFSVGSEGLMNMPGDIIQVADSHYAGTDIGGRVLAVGRPALASDSYVKLDRTVTLNGNSLFSYIDGSGKPRQIRIVRVLEDNVLQLAQVPTGLTEMGVWALSTEQVKTQLYRCLQVTEENGTYTITALQHEPQKEAIVDNGAVFEGSTTTAYKAPQISSVEIATGYDGKLYVSTAVSSGDGTLTYDVKILKDGQLYEYRKGLSDPNLALSDLPNGSYNLVIIGKNAQGQVVTESSKTFVIDRPPAPTGVVVTGGLGNITLEWDWVNEATQTEIFAAAEDNFALAEKIAKVTARTYAHTLKGDKVVRYYWLRHVRGVNTGPFYQEQGLYGQTVMDLDKRLEELNTELSRNIVNEVFDTAMPARNLGMTKYVTNLNVHLYQGQKQVYDETTNKLYSWNGSKYLPLEQELLASAIKGIIQPNQLAAIPTNKLTGLLTDTQIQELDASKIKTGTLAIERVPNVPTSKLSGTIADAQVQALSASKLSGTIALDRLPTVPTTKLSGQITDAQLSSVSASKINGTLDISKVPNIPTNKLTGTVTANQIAANVIGTNHLGANIITSEKINAGAVNARAIATDAIQAQHVSANAIDANHITANAIKSNHLFVGDYQNLIVNGSQEDGTLRGWAERFTFDTTDKPQGTTGSVVFENRTYYPIFESNVIDVVYEEQYLLEYWLKADKPNSRIYAQIIDIATGTHSVDGSPAYPIDNVIVPTEWTYFSRVLRFKHNTRQVKFQRLWINHPNGSEWTAVVKMAGVRLRPMNKGNLIVDGAVSANKIQANAITADKIATNAVTAVKIQSNAITSDKIDANAVTAQKIAGNAVEASHIKAGAIVAGKLAANAVVADNIATNAVTAIKIAANAITAEKLSVNSVGANAIQAGAITTDKLEANSVDAGKIKASAINAQHIAAGQISADKLAIGLGGNLLYNPIFDNDGYGWHTSNGTYTGGTVRRQYIAQNTADWTLKNSISDKERLIKMVFVENITTAKNQWSDVCRQKIHLIPNQWYMFSVYANAYRCSAQLLVEELNAEGGYVKQIASVRLHNRGSFVNGIDQRSRNFVKFQCPASGYIEVMIRADQQTSSNPDVYVARPMLEECTEYTQEPSAWVNAGVTSIHGGSILSNTVTAQQIAANTITSNEIAAGTIAARNMAANSINASHIVGSSITADKLKVTQLSAIAQNVGTLTGGTIKGTNITGNTISGGTITGSSITGTTISGGTVKGTTIEGGTIRGARIEGLTIEAQNIIGDVVKVYAAKSDVNITIPASSKSRIAYVMPVILPVRGYFRRIGSDNEEWVYDGASVLMTVNGVAKLSAESGGSNNIGVFQGSFSIPANTQTSVKFSASGLLSKNTQFIIFCNNA